ncbi:MAG: hypothetical protein IIB45_10825 [Candidatus Marinimicrobia bacterium]|nr:hypothetical protein [Candidatus Neomarinimicrobiota bacterium]
MVNNYRKEKGIDPIIIDAGDAFFASSVLAAQNVEADKLQAKALMQGYEKIGCDALNIGGFDLASGLDFIYSLQEEINFPFISANLTDLNNQLLFEPYTIIEKSGFKIGITGVTNHIPSHVVDVKKRPYKEAGNAAIQELKTKVDYIVLLANVQNSHTKTIAADFPDANYIFISRTTKRTRPSSKQVENGPYVYGSGIQGKYLTVVELDIKDDVEPIVDISTAKEKLSSIDRRLKQMQKNNPDSSLEKIYADKPNVLKLITDYRQQIVKYETIMAQAINTSKYESLSLSKSVGEDLELLAFVDETLATCKSLRRTPIKVSKKIIMPKSGPFKKKIIIN